jgi:mandelate racemase
MSCALLKPHWSEWQDWANPVLQKQYEMKDGSLHIPDVPSVGLDWNEEVVAPNQANL